MSTMAVAGYVGKKIIEIGFPVAKQAGKIAFSFAKGGVDGVINADSNMAKPIALSKNLDVVSSDLNIPDSFRANQFIKIKQEISDDLSVIKGQNEILFLSHSIKYFVESHASRIGVDRGISYALQYDIKAVINHIRKNPNIRFPGYLLHQCNVLAETIKEYNIFYESVVNDGYVTDWNQEKANSELDKKFGPEGEKNPLTNYIPFEYQLSWERNKKQKKKKRPIDVIFGSDDEILDEAHDALMILSGELIANEALEEKISNRLAHCPNKKLLIKSKE